MAVTAVMTLTSAMLPAYAEPENGVYLNVDYDENRKDTYEKGNTFNTGTGKSFDGSKCLTFDTNWTESGYELAEPIPSDGEDYNVSFDIKVDSPSGGYYFMMLTERASEKGDSVYHQFGLLRVTNDNKFYVAGTKLDGADCELGKWYSYKMTFNRKSRKIDVTITDKENPEIKAEASFNAEPSGSYGNALRDDRVYDALKFSAGAKGSLDNLLIEESKEKPLLVSKVSSAYAGNVFSMNDTKTLDLTLRNVLTSPVTAKIGYSVLDEDENLDDSGVLEDISVDGRGQITVPVTVNLDRYDVYKIYFDIDVNNTVTGEQKKYSSDGYMLSVANKRKKTDPKNPMTAANTEYLYSDEDWKPLEELLIGAGISAIRKEISWGYVEPTPGTYQEDPKTFYLQELADDGIDYMAIISPSSYPYSQNWDRMRVDQMEADGFEGIWDTWAKHLEYIATTYKGRVKYYEIYNEPNEHVQPDVYCKYLEYAYAAIKKCDPDAVVVGFSTASMPWAWIEQTLEIVGKDPGKYLDAISIHPYDFDYGEYRTKSPAAGQAWSILFRDQNYIDKNTRLKEMMEKYGCGGISVLGTEIGMTATPGVFSLKAQAADMMQMFTTTQIDGIIDRVWIYCFENTATRGTSWWSERNTEDNFGIVGNRNDTVPWAAKPSYLAMCAYNGFMTGSEYIDQIVDNPMRAYRFKKTDGKQVVMLWSDEGSRNIGLNLGAKTVDIYDQYSNHVGTMHSDTGVYDFTATFEPMYIVGSFDKMEEAAPTVSVSSGRITAVCDDTATFTFTDSKKRSLRVEAVGTPQATVTANSGIIGGSGKVVVKTTAEAAAEEPVEIHIYDGDELVYYGRLHIVIQDEGISVRYSLGENQTAEGRNVVNVSVTNKTAGTTMTGGVTADFTKVGGKVEDRMIVDLEPGETKTVYMNIPKSSYVRSIGAPLSINFGGRFNVEQNVSIINPMTVSYNTSGKSDTHALDGDLSGSQQFAANDALACISVPDWGGASDLGMTGTLRWDEKNMYIYAEVTDDVFFQDKTAGDVWEADGLQIGVQDPTQTTATDTAFTELGVSMTKNGVEVYRFSNMTNVSNKPGLMDSSYADIQVLPGKVVYKIAIPWQEIIGKETVSEGDSLRFNISANENDGSGRRGWCELTEGICGSKNAQLFSTILLSK